MIYQRDHQESFLLLLLLLRVNINNYTMHILLYVGYDVMYPPMISTKEINKTINKKKQANK